MPHQIGAFSHNGRALADRARMPSTIDRPASGLASARTARTMAVRLLTRVVAATTLATAVSTTQLSAQVTFGAVADSARTAPAADERIQYGSAPQQFVELRKPAGAGLHPVVMLLHGGCWLSQYDLTHLAGAAESMRCAGIATWTVEYRRVGNDGGGDPGTFDDIRAAFDTLRAQGASRGLDVSRIALVGHSAGGHLALWLGSERGVTMRGVIGLAAVTDLAAFVTPTGCGAAVARLLGGAPADVAAAYGARSPVSRPSPSAGVTLVVGRDDRTVPRVQADSYVARFPATRVVEVPGGHFDVVAPWTEAFATVLAAIVALLR